LRQGMPLLF